MNKFIMITAIAFTLIQSNNSFGMLRALPQGKTLLRIPPKFRRNITLQLTPEKREALIKASEQLEQDCNTLLPQNKRSLALLVSHISLTEFVKSKNLENLAKLNQKNPDNTYDLYNLAPQIECLDYLAQQLADKE